MKKSTAYLGLLFVVLLWGVNPLFTVDTYKYFSPIVRLVLVQLIAVIGFLPFAWKSLGELKTQWRPYLKASIMIGLCIAFANAFQKIGLVYTTPAKYAFLEQLSCIVVPFLMWWLASQKPNWKSISAALICLVGAFVLNGISLNSLGHWGIGEVLCAAAGIIYGVNIAIISICVSKLNVALLMLLRSMVAGVVYLVVSLVCNVLILPGHTQPLEVPMLPSNPWLYVYLVVLIFVTSVIGWLVRSECMRYISANAVAVIMNFSAVVTGVVSVCLGQDHISFALVAGGGLILCAILLSSFAERRKV